MGFEIFPPDLNSALMYSGPGSESMAAGAAAWSKVAADLYSTSASYASVVSGLGSGWQGPTSTAMATAVAPFVTWMNTTAATAEQVASKLNAAVSAFETAFAMTVPPPMIEANHLLTAALTATNFFGQNTPHLATLAAQYASMWTQDGIAMNTYAASAAQSAVLPALSDAPAATSGAGVVGALTQAASAASTNPLATLSSLTSALPNALAAATSSSGSPLSGITSALSGLGISQSTLTNAAVNYSSIPLRFLMYPLSYLMRFLMPQGTGAGLSNGMMDGINNLVNAKFQPLLRGLMQVASRADAALVAAHMGQAPSIAGLSVPQGWASAAQTISRAAPVLPNTSVSAPTVSAGMPGGAFGQALMGALVGRGFGGVASKIPAKVIPRAMSGG